jgi:hypothetical protein
MPAGKWFTSFFASLVTVAGVASRFPKSWRKPAWRLGFGLFVVCHCLCYGVLIYLVPDWPGFAAAGVMVVEMTLVATWFTVAGFE